MSPVVEVSLSVANDLWPQKFRQGLYMPHKQSFVGKVNYEVFANKGRREILYLNRYA